MASLDEVRRRFPPDDSAAYAAAYAEAELAGDVGALVAGLRVAAGLSRSDLAVRMGVGEDEVLRAEEGDASLTVAFLDRAARAAGARLRLAAATGGPEVVLGSSKTAPSPTWPSPRPEV